MHKELYDLTNPQRSIWLTEEFYKGTSIGNITGTVIISEKVNLKVLEKAVNLFVKNNDSFRTKLVVINGEIKQYIDDFSEFSVEILNVKTDKDVKQIEKNLSCSQFKMLDSFLFTFKLFRFENGHGGFIMNAHHIISDAWTESLTINGIIDLYNNLINNLELPSQIPSYIDYINSEKNYLSSSKFEKDKLYWNNLFSEIPEAATIPSSKSQNNLNLALASASKRKLFTLPKETIEQINEFCKSTKSSAYNFFMGVFSIYIGKLINLNDFVIGTPILNRLNFKDKNTTGMFISTVPVRISLNQENSFSEFVSGLSSEFFNIFRHQKYPYQYLLEDLRKTNSSIPNLYNIMISYQNARSNKQTANINYDSRWIPNNNISDSIDIHLYDMNDTGNISIIYDYQTSKYGIDDICSMHARILHIINQILENTSVLLKDIEIVIPDEKEQILYKFNNTKSDYPNDKTISQLFEEQVKKTPDNIAVVFEDKSLTYKELNEKSNSLANYLRAQQIGRNDLVGIMVNRSLEMIIAILGVLKSGATYIPIDPEYPEDRISYMLENSNAKILLTFNNLKNKLSFDNKIFIELENSDIYSLNTSNLKNINEPEDSAYVIYTSGSTGKPKGVVLNHKALSNLTNYCNNYVQYLKNNIYRSIVSVTTVSFDIFIFETLISLQKGLKLVISNESEQTIPRLLNSLIEKNNIEIIQTTPSRMQLLLNNFTDIPALKNLNFITLAGEQLPLSLVQALTSISNCKVYNGYGPSETTTFSSLTDVTNHNPITIGKPLDNTYFYILNNSQNLLPVNCIGEIYIAGDGVGKGYLNNTQLTNELFVNNPFSNNSPMYKTGDLGYWNENGEVSCLGRADNQVKIRGLRIELEEIENKLLEIENITSCVVVKKVSETSHEFLCAYYTISAPININSVRDILKKQLPNYMVPQYFIELESLPYTPNGKIDRKKLPEPIINEKEEIVPARNDIDSKLISILQELLNLKAISITDSFFSLGGDSLSAINLCTKIFNEFSVQLFVKDILENSIIENLSDVIAEKSGIIDSNTLVITKAAEKEFYPVSSAQKRMFFASSIAGNNSILYNLPGVIVLDSFPDIEKLQNCFNDLIKRHEIFRTYFELEKEEVVQKVNLSAKLKLEISKEAVNIEKINSAFSNFIKPFNLQKAPLIRAKLVPVLNSNKALLLVDMHHIISDGTSLNILVQELSKLYNNEILPELEISYKDFACFENSNIETDKLKEAEEFWINQFADEIPVLNMPTIYSRPAIQSYEGSKVYASINSTLKSKIEEASNKLGVTPYMFLLSCYYILLSKYTSQEDIVVGSPIVGRNLPEIQNVIGMFVNSLPLRNTISCDSSFKDFLNSVKEKCLNCYKYQTFPFDELVTKLNIKRDTSRNPLFDTMFIFQNNGYTNLEFKNINAQYYIPDTKISKFDLSLEIIPKNNVFEISFEYCTKLFDNIFIERLSMHYLNILSKVLDNVDIKISNIDMLSEEEKNKILYDFNNTKMDYPKDKTISQLFEEQVQKTPNNIAVVFEDKSLTYKELNEKANSLANYLRINQIEKNHIVGIMFNRSLEMIISILGVLKSGGAYLLIDSSLPSDRIEYMLKNCSSKLLLTNLDSTINFENKFSPCDIFNSPTYKNLNNINSPEDTFAIIYTSGSTGSPKGVKLHHLGLINLIFSFDKLMHLSAMKNHLGFASVSFDMFAVELFSSILLGRTLYLLNEEEQKNPVLINKTIIKNAIDFLITTPTKIELLLSTAEASQALNFLKGFQLGGEVFSPSLYEKLRTYTKAKIYNGYGPTEITACCSNKLISSSNDITIGFPNPNTRIYVLDKNMNVCPINVPGEIYVSGVGVSSGYINDEEKTLKVFLNNPIDSDIIYKTGDIGKFNSVGEIIYIGRNDFQVKIKGLRIELSEIEKHFLDIEYINNCIVLPNETNSYLKAFFTATEELNIPTIRKSLATILPEYMIPNYIFQIDSMPITKNGKINRKELNAYKCEICDSNLSFTEPETDTQKLFCTIWENILNTKVGIDNNLFELGADSLSAIKFKVEALNNNFDISYADIFNHKTIRKLSEIKSKIIETTPIENYNYANIHSVLKKNRMYMSYNINVSTKNNVLLFGSNGFVGMHIIKSFIENDTGKIYCVMRDKNTKTAFDRFLEILHFYFNTSLDKYINNKIFIVKGDITKPNFGFSLSTFNIIKSEVSIIINAAANVKHYGNFEKFKSINIDSTVKIIDFCKQYSKRLLHLSTLSVSGNMFLENSTPIRNLDRTNKVFFAENNLFINQSLDNVYIRSKFEAEKIILENISSGLDAQILRLGNISSRFSDGVFQINPESNAFANKFKSIIYLGVIPKSLLGQDLEFTPVDLCSNAIIKILQNKSKKISVFHIYNYNHIKIQKLIKFLNNFNIKIDVNDDFVFKNIVSEKLSDPTFKRNLSGIINDLTPDKNLKYSSNIKVKSELSVDFLSRCKFKWNTVNRTYIEKYFNYLININFFGDV